MYEAIVFLPLLGAIIAGAITLIGARNRLPGEDPPPPHLDHAAPHVPEAHANAAPHPQDAHAEIAHSSDEERASAPPSAGSQAAELITTTLLFISWILSCYAFYEVGFAGHDAHVTIFNFITAGDLKVDWAVRVDPLIAVMLVVVTTVSALVHLYSIGYMADDPYKPRFFSYLSFFTFAMLMLVTSDNLAQLFFGWEGVGLASYLLIGFWYHKPSANAAAIKAFLVTRVGDFGFSLGIFAVFLLTGSINFETVFAQAPDLVGKSFHYLWFDADALTVICLLLFMGAMGKSAQFLLHTWLPDAMEGPTPVSALIHAATMVTAGVFMVARLSPLFELAPHAKAFVLVIGATTPMFAATVGLVQNDIKRVIAYSTCSQLGYMFVAMGSGAYSIGMFHLFTHGFFKALLFLGSGSVIIAMHHEQDMRKMGGLRHKIPFTFWMMVIGTLALTGVPGTAGYFSKDAIIEADDTLIGIAASYGFIMTVVAAALTSFAADLHDLLRRAARSPPLRGCTREPAGDARSARCSRGGRDRCRLGVLAHFRGPRRRGIFPRLVDGGIGQSRARGDGTRVARGQGSAVRHDGHRLPRGPAILHLPTRYPGKPRARSGRALPLPAQCLVFRLDLRQDLRASGDMARPAAVEGRRRLRYRRLRSGRRFGARA